MSEIVADDGGRSVEEFCSFQSLLCGAGDGTLEHTMQVLSH